MRRSAHPLTASEHVNTFEHKEWDVTPFCDGICCTTVWLRLEPEYVVIDRMNAAAPTIAQELLMASTLSVEQVAVAVWQ